MEDKRIQSANSEVKRRGFIGAGLFAAGAALGVWARRARPIEPTNPNPPALESRFAYDVSEFEKTDPALLRYRPAGEFATGFDRVSRIAIKTDSSIWAGGDKSVKLFGAEGKLQREISLDFRPHCLCVLPADELLLCGRNFFVALDSAGKEMARVSLERKTYITAAVARGDMLYIADAGNREVIICDRRSGAVIERFGQAAGGNPGFAIPSPYFDLRLDSENRLRVANTGRLRIETYSLDGKFQNAWGKAGMQIDRFCGCCNPVYFAITPNGEFITSEKGLARINIYSSTGEFKGAVAGPEILVENKELARRACVDCSVGAGFDVAVDSRNRVFALDPYQKSIRVFAPLPAYET